MTTLRAILARANQACAVLATVALLVMMILTVADVTRRGLTGESIAGVIEVAPLLLLVAVVFGLGNAEQTGTHVRTTLVTDRLPARGRVAIRCVGYLVCVVLLAWMTQLSLDRAVEAFEYDDTTAGFQSIPTGPARAVVPVGFALWTLTLLLRLGDELRKWTPRAADPEPVREKPGGTAEHDGVSGEMSR